tara:strand:+ start:440 stop:616 length:177 start_codon:yes stop_codon:yes gene_type:complete
VQITPETVVVEVLEAAVRMAALAVLVVQETTAAVEATQVRTLCHQVDQSPTVREQHRE